jgi:hypothetical protein
MAGQHWQVNEVEHELLTSDGLQLAFEKVFSQTYDKN